MNWVQLGGSLVAILVLAGIARALKLGGGGIADEAAARREAEDALLGFEAIDVVLGSDRAAAIVHGRDGSVAVLKQHGSHVAVRRVAAEAVSETSDGWLVDSGERLFGHVLVRRG